MQVAERGPIKASGPRTSIVAERTPLMERLNNDGFSQAFELVCAPILFGLLGHWLDGRFSTGAVLTVIFAIAGAVGGVTRLVLAYRLQIQLIDQGKPWTRQALVK